MGERGYIEINALKAEASDVKINPKAVEYCLVRLAKYQLIALDTRSTESLENASYFKLTECGLYYRKREGKREGASVPPLRLKPRQRSIQLIQHKIEDYFKQGT